MRKFIFMLLCLFAVASIGAVGDTPFEKKKCQDIIFFETLEEDCINEVITLLEKNEISNFEVNNCTTSVVQKSVTIADLKVGWCKNRCKNNKDKGWISLIG